MSAGIVHIGVGGFHRAHQAVVIDDLRARGLAGEWAICGVGVLPGDRRVRDVLRQQDFRYTLVLKHPSGERVARTIGSIVDYLWAPDDPAAVVERMAAPRVRIVSLTITEGGYQVGEGNAAFGLMAEALRVRRERGIAPFTVLSCDNIPGNGDMCRDALSAFAALTDPDLGAWIASAVAFPNCMVDRITPATTCEDRESIAAEFNVDDAWPVVAEPFFQWVVEDRFPGGRPPFELAGVQMVEDVEPYELMKLHLLNASHQGLCYLGRLSGYEFVHEAATDPLIVRLLTRYMEEEATPTLRPVPGVDLVGYKRTLIERFANPHVRDTIARLCADSSDRIPTWLVPVIREQLARGGPVRMSAAIVAGWARYAEGVDERGVAIDVVDRRRATVMAHAARQRATPTAFLEQRDLFGDLIDDKRFVEAYLWALDSLVRRGAQATLAALV